MTSFVLIGSESHIALKAIEILAGDPRATLVAIFVDASSGGRLGRYAKERGIPVYPADVIRKDEGVKLCAGLAPDWLINAYGTVIVPTAVLRLFPKRALNVHPGPLPEYGGLHMNQWALRNGETLFGATLHLMDDGIDAGPVVAKEMFEIMPSDTGLTLFSKTQHVAIRLLNEVLHDIMAGQDLRPVAQDLSRLRVYRHAEALDGSIDWDWSARQIVDFVRAGNYRPCVSPTYTAYVEDADGAWIEILRATAGPPAAEPPGTVVEVGIDGPRVACGVAESVVLVKAEADRVRLGTSDWRRRLNDLPGARLRGRSRA
jgi:methionyl-tRNA formyltransferase